MYGRDTATSTDRSEARTLLPLPVSPCRPQTPSGVSRHLWHQNCVSHYGVAVGEGVTNMFGFDVLDFVYLAPGLVLALWAQWRMQQACRQGKAVTPTRRITGAQAAAEVLQ